MTTPHDLSAINVFHTVTTISHMLRLYLILAAPTSTHTSYAVLVCTAVYIAPTGWFHQRTSGQFVQGGSAEKQHLLVDVTYTLVPTSRCFLLITRHRRALHDISSPYHYFQLVLVFVLMRAKNPMLLQDGSPLHVAKFS